ncbi:MAG: extracellular solute-binding protein [Verrucomicrobiae bacterium]|nr:extracellular solute-binding protein [Verrucomicrobiae bacterium]
MRFSGLAMVLLLVAPLHAADRLVVISPSWEGIKVEFARAFSEWRRAKTGRPVLVDWRDMGGTSDDLRFILSEFRRSPETIGIDLFFGGGIDPYIELEKQGLLERCDLPPSVFEGIPADLAGLPVYDPGRRWFGAALSSFGILRNDEVLRTMKLPPPRTWRDLADPALRGWVGSGDPRNSGATHMVYESILQAYGWEEGWKVILGIGRNIRQFDRSNSAAAKGCALGNTVAAVVVDFYGQVQIAETGGKRMSLVIPDGESVLTADAMGILKGAPNRATARAFVEFVLSEEGQSLWMAPRGHPAGARNFSIERMSVRPSLYRKFAGISLVKTNPFRDLRPLRYDSALGVRRWSALNALLGAVVIDRSPAERVRMRVPLAEAEFDGVIAGDWNDPIRRSQIQLEWQALGRK